MTDFSEYYPPSKIKIFYPNTKLPVFYVHYQLIRFVIMKILMKSTLLIIALSSFSVQLSFAQLEGGFLVGAMQYEGDIGGRYPSGGLSQLSNPTSKPGFTLGMELGYYVAPFLRLKSNIHIGTIYGNDLKLDKLLPRLSEFPNDAAKIERNYNRGHEYKSPINELSLGAEIYPLSIFSKSLYNSTKIQPYFSIGIGVFSFNPKGVYIGKDSAVRWVELNPLRTEGQGILPGTEPYKLFSRNLSLGIGFRMVVNEKISLVYELNFRRTETDYLDDASWKYIDISLYDSYFASDPLLRDQAKQMSNRFLYYIDPAKLYTKTMDFVNPLTLTDVFKVGATRGGRDEIINDYFYSNSIKVIFKLNPSNKDDKWMNLKYRGSVSCPTVF